MLHFTIYKIHYMIYQNFEQNKINDTDRFIKQQQQQEQKLTATIWGYIEI